MLRGQVKRRQRVWIIVLKFDSHEYVMLTGVGGGVAVHAFPTETAARAYFEDAYSRNHCRSYEASMSACVHYILFQPRIVGPLSSTQIKRVVGATMDTHELSTIAGHALGARTKGLWHTGQAVRLE